MRSAGRMVRGGVAGGVWLGLSGVWSHLAAQALSNVVRPSASANASVFTPPAGLASGYSIIIHSDWNRPGVMQVCSIEGGETISGRLTWTGATYVGVLRRESRYTECGVHGAESCIVHVVGSGDVQVAGQVTNEDGVPNLYLRWSPARETRIEVEGNCPAAYRNALSRMYRTVTHAVVIPLPRAGSAGLSLALDDQPWKVQVSP